ncbi:hypothetical protein LXL04_006998 [Taraxacum kok-saghyz]
MSKWVKPDGGKIRGGGCNGWMPVQGAYLLISDCHLSKFHVVAYWEIDLVYWEMMHMMFLSLKSLLTQPTTMESEWTEVRRKRKPSDKPIISFYVSNLPGDTFRKELWDPCAALGKHVDIYIAGRKNAASSFFAFVRYEDPADPISIADSRSGVTCRRRKAAEMFKANKNISLKWFSRVDHVGSSSENSNRVDWLKIVGLPMIAWDEINFSAIASTFGKDIASNSSFLNCSDLSHGKVCILTKSKRRVDEMLAV